MLIAIGYCISTVGRDVCHSKKRPNGWWRTGFGRGIYARWHDGSVYCRDLIFGWPFQLGGGFWGGGSAAPAANVTITGRVFTSDGLTGLRNAGITLTNSLGNAYRFQSGRDLLVVASLQDRHRTFQTGSRSHQPPPPDHFRMEGRRNQRSRPRCRRCRRHRAFARHLQQPG